MSCTLTCSASTCSCASTGSASVHHLLAAQRLIASHGDGTFRHQQACACDRGRAAPPRRAGRKFREVYESDPSDARALLNWGRVLQLRAATVADQPEVSLRSPRCQASHRGVLRTTADVSGCSCRRPDAVTQYGAPIRCTHSYEALHCQENWVCRLFPFRLAPTAHIAVKETGMLKPESNLTPLF